MYDNIYGSDDVSSFAIYSNLLPCNKVMYYLNIWKILTLIIIIVFSFDPFGYTYLLFNEF